jgi:hypothetical protein
MVCIVASKPYRENYCENCGGKSGLYHGDAFGLLLTFAR